MSTLTFSPIVSSSQMSASPNNFRLTFNNPLIELPRDTYFQISLPSTSVYTAQSTCVVAVGLESGATCTNVSTTTLKVSNGVVTTPRLNTAGSISLDLGLVTNPKGLGGFDVTIDVYTSGNCKFLTSKSQLVTNAIPGIINAKIVLDNNTRSTFQTYAFDVTPSTASLSTGDMVRIQTPVGTTISALPTCVKVSSNINSISCIRVSDRIITVTPLVNTGLYAVNKTLSFNISYIRNPDTDGPLTGYLVEMSDSTNTIYETYPNITLTFSGFVVPQFANVSYSSPLLGKPDVNVTVQLQLSSFVGRGSKLVLVFSDKFEIPSNASVISSNILFNQTYQIDTTNRQVTITLLDDILPNSTLKVVLSMANPVTNTISTGDVKFRIFTPEQVQVFDVSAIMLNTNFVCDQYCTSCNRLYSKCTNCVDNYYVTPSSACLKKTQHTEYAPSFIFLGIGGGLSILMFFVGLVCGCRNYWGNMLYAILKVNIFGFYILFTYNWVKNPVENKFYYFSIAIAGMHFVLTWIFFFILRSAVNKYRYQDRYLEIKSNAKNINLQLQVDEHRSESEIDSDYKYMFNTFMVLSLLFSCTIVRWFYSEKGKRKGYFWYFEPRGFVWIRDTFECFQVMYFLFFTFPFVALNVWFLWPNSPKEWNHYMIEAICLCALDLIVYFVAFCELANSRRKIDETGKYKEQLFGKGTKLGDKDESILNPNNKSGLLDNTIREDKEAGDDRSILTSNLLNRAPQNKLEDESQLPLRGSAFESPLMKPEPRITVTPVQTISVTDPIKPEIKVDNKPAATLEQSILKSTEIIPSRVNLPLTNLSLVPQQPNPSNVEIYLGDPSKKPNSKPIITPIVSKKSEPHQADSGQSTKREEQPIRVSDSILPNPQQATIQPAKHKKPPIQSVRFDEDNDNSVELPTREVASKPDPTIAQFKQSSAYDPSKSLVHSKYPSLSNPGSDFSPDRKQNYKKDIKVKEPSFSETPTDNDNPYYRSKTNLIDKPLNRIDEAGEITPAFSFDDRGILPLTSVHRVHPNKKNDKYDDPKRSEYAKNASRPSSQVRKGPAPAPPPASKDPRRTKILQNTESPETPANVHPTAATDPVDGTPVISFQSIPAMFVSQKSKKKNEYPGNKLKPRSASNTDRSHLEVIYEEDANGVRVEEITGDGDILINGQEKPDLERGFLRDRRGNKLDLQKQDPNQVAKGIYKLPDGSEIEMNKQDPKFFNEGLIKDINGNMFRMSDQLLPLLKSGVYLNSDGTVHNVNGQQPDDIEDGKIHDKDGNYIDLNLQKNDCFDTNEFSVNGGAGRVKFHAEQVPEKIESGIIKAPDGSEYRIKDQSFRELNNNGTYRDRSMNPVTPSPRVPRITITNASKLSDASKPAITMAKVQPSLPGRSDSDIRAEDQPPESTPRLNRVPLNPPMTTSKTMEKKSEVYKFGRPGKRRTIVQADGTLTRQPSFNLDPAKRGSRFVPIVESTDNNKHPRESVNNLPSKDYWDDQREEDANKAPLFSSLEDGKTKANRKIKPVSDDWPEEIKPPAKIHQLKSTPDQVKKPIQAAPERFVQSKPSPNDSRSQSPNPLYRNQNESPKKAQVRDDYSYNALPRKQATISEEPLTEPDRSSDQRKKSRDSNRKRKSENDMTVRDDDRNVKHPTSKSPLNNAKKQPSDEERFRSIKNVDIPYSRGDSDMSDARGGNSSSRPVPGASQFQGYDKKPQNNDKLNTRLADKKSPAQSPKKNRIKEDDLTNQQDQPDEVKDLHHPSTVFNSYEDKKKAAPLKSGMKASAPRQDKPPALDLHQPKLNYQEEPIREAARLNNKQQIPQQYKGNTRIDPFDPKSTNPYMPNGDPNSPKKAMSDGRPQSRDINSVSETMYLDLLMDESVDLEVNVEAYDENDPHKASRSGSEMERELDDARSGKLHRRDLRNPTVSDIDMRGDGFARSRLARIADTNLNSEENSRKRIE